MKKKNENMGNTFQFLFKIFLHLKTKHTTATKTKEGIHKRKKNHFKKKSQKILITIIYIVKRV